MTLFRSKCHTKEKPFTSMESPAESQICHAERVNLADKTNLPRSLRLSSDKQDIYADKQDSFEARH